MVSYLAANTFVPGRLELCYAITSIFIMNNLWDVKVWGLAPWINTIKLCMPVNTVLLDCTADIVIFTNIPPTALSNE